LTTKLTPHVAVFCDCHRKRAPDFLPPLLQNDGARSGMMMLMEQRVDPATSFAGQARLSFTLSSLVVRPANEGFTQFPLARRPVSKGFTQLHRPEGR